MHILNYYLHCQVTSRNSYQLSPMAYNQSQAYRHIGPANLRSDLTPSMTPLLRPNLRLNRATLTGRGTVGISEGLSNMRL
ncbi:hypothetical protein DPMN_180092 [Dreissena polymorpha]|uniref:Uncharacterized protein n=1 Tax=Dreissena polymorpha TaxID=45954 RepID=A0A9D4IP33_DREPO|nr:hypothetical protein DPMN_180092 [Dreissena polymorpha]